MRAVVANLATIARGTGCALLVATLAACGDAASSGAPPVVVVPVERSELFPGGAASTDRADEKAFSQAPPGLGFRDEATFKSGNLLFRNTPAGLGPLFNTQSCQGCHNQDGRGSPPTSADDPMVSMLLKLARPDPSDPGRVLPDPIYGDQLQTFGIASDGPSRGLARHDGALARPGEPFGDGAIGEGFGFLLVEEVRGTYPDGESYTLRHPTVAVRDLSYGPLAHDVRISPRVAQSMIGLGLLEAIPAEDVVGRADPDDRDRDGISGRPNLVFDVLRGESVLGRMGLKAGQPSVLQQAAAAYRGDIGITSSIFPDGPCTDEEPACRASDDLEPGGPRAIDLADLQLALVEFYARQLAVPKRRGWDEAAGDWQPEIGLGRLRFQEIGCASCHVPRHRTGVAAGSLLGDVDVLDLSQPAAPIEVLSEQTIWPYTDLLLHDMGGACAPLAREDASGEPCTDGAGCWWVQRCSGLADGLPEGAASGAEWRTPPLWGLGLVQVVNPKAGFLHDGRARTIEEAILWHDGEARAARLRFMDLDRAERRAILAFLESQ